MDVLKIIALVIVVIGVIVVFAARPLSRHFHLQEKVKLDPHFTEGMDEEMLLRYREQKAILQMKLYGLLLASPGFILILVLFKR